MIQFLGIFIMFLSVLSWINAVLLSQALIKIFHHPTFGAVYFIINTLITFVLLKTGMNLMLREVNEPNKEKQ